MAVKKSDLYSGLWDSCNELRGGMDASQYKDYVLAMLFIKYVSDKYANQTHAEVTVPRGASFADMVRMKNTNGLGDRINKEIIHPLEQKNNISGMPDFDDSNKLGEGHDKVDRLSKLIGIFERPELDFTANRADDDDILGDAYEYLMRHFAVESGKSKGQFYTPAEVSRLIARVLLSLGNNAPTNNTTFYDPTCGSGSLLLRISAEADGKGTLYGQEKDTTTAALARMNMILHNMATADIEQGNTLTNPRFMEKENDRPKVFDYVVANPPFSDKAWKTGMHEGNEYGRFGMGMPPPKQGDYAYLLHIVSSLNRRGKGACILPHGVLFRGNAEAKIRKNLLKHGYIRAIIGLPPNLFYGTGIPACIVLLDKEGAGRSRGVIFVDASSGYVKDGNKNRLREMDIRRVADAVVTAGKGNPIDGFARIVSPQEIASNDHNLNIPRYINNQPLEDEQDIRGHLIGGIPTAAVNALAAKIPLFSEMRERFFQPKPKQKNYCLSLVPPADIPAAVIADEDFQKFANKMAKHFNKWRGNLSPFLHGLKKGIRPKKIIAKLGTDILQHYQRGNFDRYLTYQRLMDLWDETMEDDCYLISANGWQAKPEPIFNKKNKKVGWECSLLPKQLLIARYFATEQAAIDTLQEQAEAENTRREALEELHDGEEELYDKEKISQTTAKKRLKDIAQSKQAADFAEEATALREWLSVKEKETALKREISQAEKVLDEKVRAHYAKLTEKEIKECVVKHKWLGELDSRLRKEVDNIGLSLGGQLQGLAEQYESSLTELSADVTTWQNKVNSHLRKMGFQN